MTFAAAEADRRIAGLVQIGTVTAVEGDLARVSVAGLRSHPIPVTQIRMGTLRMRAMPSVGEQVVVIAPDGDMERAFVHGSLPASNGLANTGAGLELDLGGGTLNITNGRIVIDGDVISGGISLQTHVHGGVVPGGGSTGEPE
jgi:phage baseplate assembly protein gpV